MLSDAWKSLRARRRSSSSTERERGEERHRGRHTSRSRGQERGGSMAVALGHCGLWQSGSPLYTQPGFMNGRDKGHTAGIVLVRLSIMNAKS